MVNNNKRKKAKPHPDGRKIGGGHYWFGNVYTSRKKAEESLKRSNIKKNFRIVKTKKIRKHPKSNLTGNPEIDETILKRKGRFAVYHKVTKKDVQKLRRKLGLRS